MPHAHFGFNWLNLACVHQKKPNRSRSEPRFGFFLLQRFSEAVFSSSTRPAHSPPCWDCRDISTLSGAFPRTYFSHGWRRKMSRESRHRQKHTKKPFLRREEIQLKPHVIRFLFNFLFFLSVENKMKHFLPVCGVRWGAGGRKSPAETSFSLLPPAETHRLTPRASKSSSRRKELAAWVRRVHAAQTGTYGGKEASGSGPGPSPVLPVPVCPPQTPPPPVSAAAAAAPVSIWHLPTAHVRKHVEIFWSQLLHWPFSAERNGAEKPKDQAEASNWRTRSVSARSTRKSVCSVCASFTAIKPTDNKSNNKRFYGKFFCFHLSAGVSPDLDLNCFWGLIETLVLFYSLMLINQFVSTT